MNSAVSFNIADGVAAAVVLLCTAIGFKRGLIGQIVPLLAVTVVAFTTWFGYTPCHDWLARSSTWSPPRVQLATVVLVIVVPLGLMMLLGRRLTELAKLPVMASFDRVGGAITGFAGGALLVFLVFLALSALPNGSYRDAVGKNSWTGRHVRNIHHQVAGTVNQTLDETRATLFGGRKGKGPKDTREKWEE